MDGDFVPDTEASWPVEVLWDEWTSLHLHSAHSLINTFKLWHSRSRLNVSIQATRALLEAFLLDRSLHSSHSSHFSRGLVSINNTRNTLTVVSVQHVYSLAIVRLVNGLCETLQVKTHALSVAALAAQLHLPSLLVDVRHDSTHSTLPSIITLRLAAAAAMRWLLLHYWIAQEMAVQNAIKSVPESSSLSTFESVVQICDDYSALCLAKKTRVQRTRTLKKLISLDKPLDEISSHLVQALFPSLDSYKSRSLANLSLFALSLPYPYQSWAAHTVQYHHKRLVTLWLPLLQYMSKYYPKMMDDVLIYLIRSLSTSQKLLQGYWLDEYHLWYRDMIVKWMHTLIPLGSMHCLSSVCQTLSSFADFDDTHHLVVRQIANHIVEHPMIKNAFHILDEVHTNVRNEHDTIQHMNVPVIRDATYQVIEALIQQNQSKDTSVVQACLNKSEIASCNEQFTASQDTSMTIHRCTKWKMCPLGVLPDDRTCDFTLSLDTVANPSSAQQVPAASLQPQMSPADQLLEPVNPIHSHSRCVDDPEVQKWKPNLTLKSWIDLIANELKPLIGDPIQQVILG